MYILITEFLKSPHPGLKRGGIVPYTEQHLPSNRLVKLYCLGLDYISGDITEFSGKIDKMNDRDIIDTALREFQEETGNVFPPITREDLIAQNADVLYDNLALIVFVRVDVDMMDIVDHYDNYIQKKIARFEEWKQEHPKDPYRTKTHVIPQKTGKLSPLGSGRSPQDAPAFAGTEESALNPEISTLIWLTESQLRTALEQNNVPPVLFYYPSGRLLLQKFSDRTTDLCRQLVILPRQDHQP